MKKINWKFVAEKTVGILLVSPTILFFILLLVFITQFQIAISLATLTCLGLYFLLKDKVI